MARLRYTEKGFCLIISPKIILVKSSNIPWTKKVSSTFQDFQTAYEGEIWCLRTMTYGQKSSKLNSRPIYCSQLYGM